MTSRTIVYLMQPRMTKSFEVEVTGEDASSAELKGEDTAIVAAFLGLSSRNPRFDVEWRGKIFRDCRLSSVRTTDTIAFTFERVRAIDEKSSPDTSGDL